MSQSSVHLPNRSVIKTVMRSLAVELHRLGLMSATTCVFITDQLEWALGEFTPIDLVDVLVGLVETAREENDISEEAAVELFLMIPSFIKALVPNECVFVAACEEYHSRVRNKYMPEEA